MKELKMEQNTAYMNSLAGDLMQLTASLLKALQALDQLPLDPQMDAWTAKYGGMAFDAVVTAHTLADRLLRDYPLPGLIKNR